MRPEEELACDLIQEWVANRGNVALLGDGDNADIEITYDDGTRGLGEVKADVNENVRKQWAAICSKDRSQIDPLPDGYGSWTMRIREDAKISTLKEEAIQIIDFLNTHSQTEWDSQFTFPTYPESETWLQLGILGIYKLIYSKEDILFTQPEGIGGAVPIDSDIAVEWIRDFLANPRWQSSWNRLIDSQTEERHIFVWIDSKSPSELRLRVTFHPDELPVENPELQPGITDLWIGVHVEFRGFATAWHFSERSGWELVKSKSDKGIGLGLDQ